MMEGVNIYFKCWGGALSWVITFLPFNCILKKMALIIYYPTL